MRLTQEQLTCLARLAKFPDGAVLVNILKERLAERDAAWRGLSGEELLRNQGRAKELEEVLKLLNDAQIALDRAQSTPLQANRPTLR